MKLDSQYWNQRYVDGYTGWDIGYASPVFQSFFKEIDIDVSILIPGAGNAYEAVLLDQMGFTDITVLDWSQYAIDQYKNEHPDSNAKLVCGDFFKHEGKYDFILEQTFFCAIDPSLRASYVKKMAGLLNPGGKIVGVMFNRAFEGGPPFGGSVEEYRGLFEKDFIIHHLERNYLSIPARMDSEVYIEFEKR